MNAKKIAGIILAGLAAIMILQNAATVELKIFFWTLPISGALLMLLILSVGTVLGWLLRRTLNKRKGTTDTKRPANAVE